MSKIGFSPYGQMSPYIGGIKSSRTAAAANAYVLFKDSAGDKSISFHLKGELGGATGNNYALMFNRISSSGPRWGIRIYDRSCNIYRSTTLTLAVAMTGLQAAIKGGGLADVLEVRVYKSVNEAFTAATCAASKGFRGGA